MLAFGGLADQFLPFTTAAGEEATLGLASVVMKAVQATHPQRSHGECMPCAAKLGDDSSASKAQVWMCDDSSVLEMPIQTVMTP